MGARGGSEDRGGWGLGERGELTYLLIDVGRHSPLRAAPFWR